MNNHGHIYVDHIRTMWFGIAIQNGNMVAKRIMTYTRKIPVQCGDILIRHHKKQRKAFRVSNELGLDELPQDESEALFSLLRYVDTYGNFIEIY